MAELVIKVGDRSNRPSDYKDGDVLCAFSDRHIRYVHAQHICHPRKALRTNAGLIDPQSHAMDLCVQTARFRFDQVSQHVVEKTDLVNGGGTVVITGPEFSVTIAGSLPIHVEWSSIVGSTLKASHAAILFAAQSLGLPLLTIDGSGLKSNGVPVASTATLVNPEFTRVAEFVRRRRKKADNCLFQNGRFATWFGGHRDLDDTVVSNVWDAIETKTPNLRTDRKHVLWPMGRQDIRSHLAVRSVAMTTAEVEELVQPQFTFDANGDQVWEATDPDGTVVTASGENPPQDERIWQPAITANRNVSVNWKAQLRGDVAESIEDIEDPNVPIGNDVQEGETIRHESKDQPLQNPNGVKFARKGRVLPVASGRGKGRGLL